MSDFDDKELPPLPPDPRIEAEKKAKEEAAALRRAEEAAAEAQRRANEEAAARRRAEETAARQKAEADAARQQAEAARQRADAEAAERQRTEAARRAQEQAAAQSYSTPSYSTPTPSHSYSGSSYSSDKSWGVLVVLSIVLGGLGADRFYAGRIGLGIMKLISMFVFGIGVIWWIVDIFLAITGKQKDGDDNYIERSSSSYYDDDDKRGAIISGIFGIVIGIGLAFTLDWIFIQITGISPFPIIPFLIALGAGIVITFLVWRNRKYIIFFILLVLCIPGWLAVFSIIPENPSRSLPGRGDVTTATVTANALNFRAEPSSSAAVIKALKKDDVVIVTGDDSGGWTPVEHDGAKGWVGTQHIKISETKSSSANKQQTRNRQQTPAPVIAFPSEYFGNFRWKNPNAYNTYLTFTAKNVKCNQQYYSFNLVSVSGNTYTVLREYHNENRTLNIRVESNKMIITEDTGTGNDNWNGTWEEVMR